MPNIMLNLSTVVFLCKLVNPIQDGPIRGCSQMPKRPPLLTPEPLVLLT